MASIELSLGERFSSLPDEIYEAFVSVSCLNVIMKWIDLNNFFKILATKEMKRRFNAMNRSIVKKGLSLEEFPFQISFSDFNEDACNIIQTKDGIEINGMKMILSFLRHFGAEIDFLNCNYYGASEDQVFIIFAYISKYCTNLKKLYFVCLRHSLSHSLRSSFEHVTELFFFNCRLDKNLCNLVIHFPRVKEISFCQRNEFQDINRVMVSYPHLLRMTIEHESMHIISAALLQAINPEAKIAYLGGDLNVMVLNLS